MRHGLDMLLAVVALLLLLPVMLLIALAVAVSSGRPVFFRQLRAGRDGVPFHLIKFRSMSEARDAQGNFLADTARITAIGRVLRRTRLDELPELWNIIRGDMAFIGPRPLLPETVAAMGDGGARRGGLRPGLTGWAQVNGNSLLTAPEKLSLDLWYVENRSPAVDILILLRTLCVMVAGERINRSNLERAYAGNSRRSG